MVDPSLSHSTLSIDIDAQIGSFQIAVKFEVEPGITVLTGPSGSGKSSILNFICGLRRPQRGLIRFGERKFYDSEHGIDMAPQYRKCGYVLQNLALFPHMNVAANVCFGIDNLSRGKQQRRLEELLTLVKLEGMETRKISQLSGGQLQRVALARALAPAPDILLLDEPFSALDIELRESLGKELKALNNDLRLPILMVTHSKAEALQLADTLILLDHGQISQAGSLLQIESATRVSLLDPGAQFSW